MSKPLAQCGNTTTMTDDESASISDIAFPVDGIVKGLPYVDRPAMRDHVIEQAKRSKALIVGAPPAMGKTSLLQMVKWKLKEDNVSVCYKRIPKDAKKDDLAAWLKRRGITDDEDELSKLPETWLLFDDAQNSYGEDCYGFWEDLLKGIKTIDEEDNIVVIIAATYDLTTPDSPVVFSEYPHIVPNFTLEESEEAVGMYSVPLGVQSWDLFFGNLRRLARLHHDTYHIGVMIAGFRLIQDLKKDANEKHLYSELHATNKLRSTDFLSRLKRCFGLPVDAERNDVHAHSYDIADAVLKKSKDSIPVALLRSGILAKNGEFASTAASWYYNRVCFPNRADVAPESLDDLVIKAVGLLSAKRLSDKLEDGFPKEATFQHLFNEALSNLLPISNYVIPEFNTFALDEKQNPVYGELDFYINGDLQWCLELLRNGDKIGDHLARFHPSIGKYREVVKMSYLVVDCRGPKKGEVKVDESRCTLYFAEDFRSCICKMRLQEEVTLSLKM